MFSDPEVITRVQTFKGLAFILTTALLLFILVLRNYQKVERAFQLDGLTGLLNHHMFKIQLDRQIAQLKKNQKLIVSYLDINKFKELNQTIGFDRADHLLLNLAKDIEAYTQQSSTIGRLPPDQFAIARQFYSRSDIDNSIRGLHAAFNQTARKMGVEASCSIGVAIYPDDGNTAKTLMNAASAALYTAKRNGNAVQYHDKALTHQAAQRREMLEDLKAAIDSKAFTLVYQPKYVFDNYQAHGLEVLIRWHHPVKGFISPAEFIPIAEEFGLSHAITRIVIERAAEELKQSQLLGKPIQHVSINVSATEFNDFTVMEGLLEFIKNQPILLPYLLIEITETATLNDIQQSSAIINQLREAGIGISVDDFGTGYTSLAMLKDFTIDEIKIDRSFVSELENDGRSKTIIAAVIAMARSFNISVVAEGVETQEQLQQLKSMGCHQAQGFYLGIPMTIGALQEHLSPAHLSPKNPEIFSG